MLGTLRDSEFYGAFDVRGQCRQMGAEQRRISNLVHPPASLSPSTHGCGPASEAIQGITLSVSELTGRHGIIAVQFEQCSQ
jgi:hypothetical protein